MDYGRTTHVAVSRKISSYSALDKLGRVRLSEHFFMREMLYSEISNYHGIPNFPEDTALAIEAGSRLCQDLLEPLRAKFGHVVVRSAYRSPTVNKYGNENKLNCSSNEKTAADHIWDMKDSAGNMGACATIQLPWFLDRQSKPEEWISLAWWIHDHLPYHSQFYFHPNGTMNLAWRENAEKWVRSYVTPKGYLTKQGMDNWAGDHSQNYSWIDEKLK